MKDKIETFSKYGDAGHGGITRYSLSEAAIKARNEFKAYDCHRAQLLRQMMLPICTQQFRVPTLKLNGL